MLALDQPLDPAGDPATLSRPIITGILRDRLGYDGVVMTDRTLADEIRRAPCEHPLRAGVGESYPPVQTHDHDPIRGALDDAAETRLALGELRNSVHEGDRLHERPELVGSLQRTVGFTPVVHPPKVPAPRT